jgi:hypothetical protein
VVEVLPVDVIPPPRDGGQVDAWLVEPPVASSPTRALTIALLVDAARAAGLGRQAPQAGARGAGQRLAKAGAGLDEGAVGTCSPISSIIIWLLLAVP